MSEQEKPKRTRSHTLRDYAVTLTNGNTVIVQSDDLRNARKKANAEYGEAFVVEVKHARGSRRNPAWLDRTRNERTKEREAEIKAMAERFGYPNKSALLTALLKGEATIVKVEKP